VRRRSGSGPVRRCRRTGRSRRTGRRGRCWPGWSAACRPRRGTPAAGERASARDHGVGDELLPRVRHRGSPVRRSRPERPLEVGQVPVERRRQVRLRGVAGMHHGDAPPERVLDRVRPVGPLLDEAAVVRRRAEVEAQALEGQGDRALEVPVSTGTRCWAVACMSWPTFDTTYSAAAACSRRRGAGRRPGRGPRRRRW
jgi:hypothetical protein